MNKVYKVIWSKARNCYVVVSELAKRNGKSSSSLNKKIIAAFLAAGMTMAATVSVEASAVGVDPNSNATNLIKSGTGSGTNYVAVGDNAVATGSYAVAVGNAATTGRKATEAEAQIGAYNALQATIKADAAFENVAAVQNAKTYAALVNALNSVGTAEANSYVTQLQTRVTSLQNATPPTSTNAIAVGNNATAGGTSAIAVGNAATALKEDGTAANNAIAVGNGAKARNTNAIAVGQSNGSFKQTGLSDLITSGAWGVHDIAIGTDAAAHGERKDPTDGSTLSSILDGGGKFAEGGSGYAIAVGYRAQALRQFTIAVGEEAMATGDNAVALGHGARALTQGSIVIGGERIGSAGVQQGYLNTALDALDTVEHGGYSISIGTNAMNFTTNFDQDNDNYFANTKNSIAIGHFAHTHAANAFAIGVSTDATAERAFAIGTASTQSTTAHQGARAAGQGSLVWGDQARAVTLAMEFGAANERGVDLNVNDSIAIGTQAHVMATNAIALGGNMSYTTNAGKGGGTTYYGGTGSGAMVAEGADAGIAIGGAYGTREGNDLKVVNNAAQTYGKRGIAIGSGALVEPANDATAVQTLLESEGYKEAKIGYDTARAEYHAALQYKNNLESQLETLEVGTSEYNEIYKLLNGEGENPGAIKDLETKETQYNAANVAYQAQLLTLKTISGNAADVAKDAIAIGTNATARMLDSIAIGDNAHTGDLASRSIAVGLNAETGKLAAASIAIGSSSKTGLNAAGSISLGLGNETGENAVDGIAIGVMNLANGAKSIAIGSRNQVDGDRAIAVGIDAKAYANRSVALGCNSLTSADNDRAGAVTGIIGYDMGTGKSYTGTDRYTPVWMSTAGSLSVGGGINKEGELVTRRITNVAAGASDTEAVNVAQLKRAIDQTVMTSDNRSVGIGKAKVRGLEIISPYYEMNGIGEAVEAISFMNHYADVQAYKNKLDNDLYGKNEGGSDTNPTASSLKGQLNTITTELNNLNAKKDTLTNRKNKLEEKRSKYEYQLSLSPTDPNYDPTYLTDPDKAFTDDDIKELVATKVELTLVTDEIGVKETEKASKQQEITDKKTEIFNASTTFSTYEELSKTRASATGTNATAIGYKAIASGESAIAFGKEAKAEGKNAISLGTGGTVSGDNSISIGTGNVVTGAKSGAFGDPSTINGANSYSVGNNNIIAEGKTDVFALGNNITSVESYSVFLGSNSAYSPADNKTTAGLSSYNSMTVNINNQSNTYLFAGGGEATIGVVSVGGGTVEGKVITRRIQNVAPGLISAESTDAINGSQLYQAMQALSIEVKADETPTKSTKVDVTTKTSGGTTGGGTTGGGTTAGGTTGGGTTVDGGAADIPPTDEAPAIVLKPATTTYTVYASTTTAKAGSKNIVVDETRVSNNPKSYEYTIDLAKDIEVDSVKAGDTTMNSNGITIANGPSMTKDGVNAGSKKISNVAKGDISANSTDAINGSQLYDTMNTLNNHVSNVDSRARKGIAGAAALAALHPLEFDPDDKLTFAAGVGNYRGETAAAIGAFYRADEKVMFSIGGSMGNGENVVNAGVSFSLDRTPRQTSSRAAMAREIVELREQVAQLTAIVNQLAGGQLPVAPVMYPNTPENAWAYEYLENLQKQGTIVGYTGRELSRAEFAAALDRAMMSGAKLDERLIKEFEPELSHVRVSHVAGKGEDEGGWYERPRTSHDKLENQHEIAKKPLRPQEKSVTSKS